MPALIKQLKNSTLADAIPLPKRSILSSCSAIRAIKTKIAIRYAAPSAIAITDQPFD
jgi:hypothetical protein